MLKRVRVDPEIYAYRKTCKRHNEPGHAHYLTFSCFHRQPFLDRDRAREWMVQAMELARRTHDLELWAYVIMPEHVHLIIFPRQESYSIAAILNTIKQSVSKKALAFVAHTPPHSCAECSIASRTATSRIASGSGVADSTAISGAPATFWEKIDYVHANPVRRHLCGAPEEWPWSSAADHAGRCHGPLALNWDSLPGCPS